MFSTRLYSGVTTDGLSLGGKVFWSLPKYTWLILTFTYFSFHPFKRPPPRVWFAYKPQRHTYTQIMVMVSYTNFVLYTICNLSFYSSHSHWFRVIVPRDQIHFYEFLDLAPSSMSHWQQKVLKLIKCLWLCFYHIIKTWNENFRPWLYELNLWETHYFIALCYIHSPVYWVIKSTLVS